MEEDNTELFISNYTSLRVCLSNSIHNVCDFLYQKNIINKSVKENILCKETPRSQSTELLDLIISRGATARLCGALYKACKINGLQNAADILRPDKAPHKISSAVKENDQPLPVPDHWSLEEHHKRVKNNELNVTSVTMNSSPEMLKKYKTHFNNEATTYQMYHKCRGNAWIINNKYFSEDCKPPRKGSEWDLKGSLQLFRSLGFQTREAKNENWSKEDLDQIIKEEAEADHKDHDCFVFFIMSHGDCGYVFDKDGKLLSLRSIIKRISMVEDLKDKPKLIFVQACQGDNVDEGHANTRASGASALASPENDIELNVYDHAPAGGEEDLSESLPDDVFVFTSSTSGSKSIRNAELGSWFTQAIIKVFSEFAYKCEMTHLCRKVNDLMSKAETIDDRHKNVGELHIGRFKKLYFFPGLDGKE